MANILYAEDHKSMREAIVSILQDAGHTVTAVVNAGNGRDAIREAQTAGKPLDAIITDWNMPGGNGAELIQFARDQGLQMPILVMTLQEHVGDLIASNPVRYKGVRYLDKMEAGRELLPTIAAMIAPAGGPSAPVTPSGGGGGGGRIARAPFFGPA